MLDFDNFETEIQAAANERIVDVIEGMIDRMLNIEPDLSIKGCSYAQYHESYVRIKLMIRKLVFQTDFYWEKRPMGYYREPSPTPNKPGGFIIRKQPPQVHGIHQKVQQLMPKMEEAHTKMYANPCKTCTTCQSRRKRWPTLPSPLS